MARIPNPSNLDGEVADRIRARRGGQLTALDEMLLWSPAVADGWNAVFGAIRSQTELDPLIRELVMLRIAVLNDAPFEWDQHEPVARENGADDALLDAIRGDLTDPVITAQQRLALTYADQMTRAVQVPADLFDQVRREFGDRVLVELTLTSAGYNMVSRFLVALEVGT